MLVYKLSIKPNDYKTLRRDIWSDDHVPGILRLGREKVFINISFRGSSIRKHEKKSYNVLFKKPFFINGEHEIHLNAEYKDPSLIRNKLSLDFFNSIGVFAPKSQYVLLYINEYFKGIYLQLESFDQYLLKKTNQPDGCVYYAINNDANFSLVNDENELKSDILQGYTAKYDKIEGHHYLLDLIIKINTLPDKEFYNEISKMIDVDQYLRWLTGVVCTQNFDGFIQNYALYRNGDTNLFEISPWDYDGTWGRDRHGVAYEHDYINIKGYNTLTARLLNIPPFRSMYKSIMESVLQNQFTEDYQAPIIESLYQELRPHIINDPYIGSKVDEFEAEPELILKFIRNRNLFLTQELSSLH